MSDLTVAQAKALEFIKGRMETKGSSPTLREICNFMGFSAIGSAQDVVAALRKKGFLESPNKQAARALMLTTKARSILSNVVSDVVDDGEFFLVPCLGSVPAGNPLEAIEHRVDTLRISSSLLSRPKPKADQLFAVRTSGLSMIGAGILDGDWLVVRVQEDADVGQIVVARVGADATCKRLMHDIKKGWYLKAENPDFDPIFAKDEAFEIVGRVVALQRSL